MSLAQQLFLIRRQRHTEYTNRFRITNIGEDAIYALVMCFIPGLTISDMDPLEKEDYTDQSKLSLLGDGFKTIMNFASTCTRFHILAHSEPEIWRGRIMFIDPSIHTISIGHIRDKIKKYSSLVYLSGMDLKGIYMRNIICSLQKDKTTVDEIIDTVATIENVKTKNVHCFMLSTKIASNTNVSGAVTNTGGKKHSWTDCDVKANEELNRNIFLNHNPPQKQIALIKEIKTVECPQNKDHKEFLGEQQKINQEQVEAHERLKIELSAWINKCRNSFSHYDVNQGAFKKLNYILNMANRYTKTTQFLGTFSFQRIEVVIGALKSYLHEQSVLEENKTEVKLKMKNKAKEIIETHEAIFLNQKSKNISREFVDSLFDSKTEEELVVLKNEIEDFYMELDKLKIENMNVEEMEIEEDEHVFEFENYVDEEGNVYICEQ